MKKMEDSIGGKFTGVTAALLLASCNQNVFRIQPLPPRTEYTVLDKDLAAKKPLVKHILAQSPDSKKNVSNKETGSLNQNERPIISDTELEEIPIAKLAQDVSNQIEETTKTAEPAQEGEQDQFTANN